jgi:predicted nucleic-acid-binding protein
VIAVDTNVLVRFLTADDAEQHRSSVALLETTQVFIPDTVILETGWVLGAAYGFAPEQVTAGLRNLLGLPTVHLRDAAAVALALEWCDRELDFADAMHLALSQHGTQMETFDQRFVSRARQIASYPVHLLAH